MKAMTKIDPLHRLYMLYCLNFVDSINPYKACYMFYWQDFDLLTKSFLLTGCFEPEYGTVYHSRGHARPEKKQSRKFWYQTIAFKASIMSENRNNTHIQTPSKRTGWWTRSNLGSFKTQNMINLECFCYPKQLQLNLDPPNSYLKRFALPPEEKPLYPRQIYIVDIFGRPTVLE